MIRSLQLFVTVIALLAASQSVEAQSENQGARPARHHGHGRGPSAAHIKAMEACMTEKGLQMPPRPESGERPELDEATREAFDACREKVHASTAACEGSEGQN